MRERISNNSFRLMSLIMKVIDALHPYIGQRAGNFGIKEGMTVVDYGCGPGRYVVPFAQIVGEKGKVIAVDLNEIAFVEIEKRIKRYHLNNVQFRLAKGYDSNVESGTADMVFALDMFFMVEKPGEFLKELSRISKQDGILIIDDGHQPREKTEKKIGASGIWQIVEETRDYLKCKKA